MKRPILLFLAIFFCFSFQVNAQNVFPTTGNVGIGTSSPSYLLDVNGVARAQTRLIVGTGPLAAGVQTTDQIVTSGGIRGVTYLNFYTANTASNIQTGLWNSGYTLQFYHANSPGVAFSAANGAVTTGAALSFAPAFNPPGGATGDVYFSAYSPVFYPAGNTSINYYGLTVSPGWQATPYSNSLIGIFRGYYFNNLLYTTSTANDIRAIETNGGKIIFSGTVQNAVSNLARGVQITHTIPAAANNDVLVGVDINPTFTNGTFTGVSNIALRVSGNTLIGRTTQVNSSYILDVNGVARINQVVVNATGADFVFDSGYRLSPLWQVDKYIRAHHHLPDIVPAERMQEQGMDLGGTQTVLLKKVEELTLYLIREEKQIAAQQHEIEVLKKMIAKKTNKIP